MARTKTTETPTITAAQLADGDWFPVIDVSDTTTSPTGRNKKVAKSEMAEVAGLSAHLADATDAHDASAISFSATGNLSSTDVQAAIAELDSEKAAVAEPIAAAHIADTSDAHDASAISVLDTAGNYTATDVEAALAELPSRFASLSNPYPSAAVATDGTYARTSTSTRMLAIDPLVSGRVWGTNGSSIGYRDSHGTADFVAVIAHPSAQSPVQITFTATYAFVLTSGFANRAGQLWRSPLPGLAGTGWSFTGPLGGKIHDLTGVALGVAGAATDGGDTSYYRSGCFATDGTNGYLLEYGGTITGGPSFYQCANLNVIDVAFSLWSKRKTWTAGKHGHAVQVIGGVPWATIGDGGAAGTYTDIGLWTATAANGATWNRRSLYGEVSNGTYHYPIDFTAMTIGGASVVVGEYDGYGPSGPLVFDSQDPTVTRPLRTLCDLPYPYTGSMRGLTRTSAGHLLWLTTGEGGAIGTLDSVWIAKAPFTNPILLESVASSGNTFGTVGQGCVSGSGSAEYAWIGAQRLKIPTLL